MTEATSLAALRSATVYARATWSAQGACALLAVFAICSVLGGILLAVGRSDAQIAAFPIFAVAGLALLCAGVSCACPCHTSDGALFLDAPGDVAPFDSLAASRGRLPAEVLEEAWANLLWGWALARGRQLSYAAPAAAQLFGDAAASHAGTSLLGSSGAADGVDVTSLGGGSFVHLHACGLAEFVTKSAYSACCGADHDAGESRAAVWAADLRWLRTVDRGAVTVGLPGDAGTRTMPSGDLIAAASSAGRTHLPPQLAALGRAWLSRPPRAGSGGGGGEVAAAFTTADQGSARQAISVDADWTTVETVGQACCSCCAPRERLTFRTADIPFVYMQRAAVEGCCASWTLLWLGATLTAVVIVAAFERALGASLTAIIAGALVAAVPVLSTLHLLSFTAVGTLCCRRVAVVIGSPGAAAFPYALGKGSRACCGGCGGRRGGADAGIAPIVLSARGDAAYEQAAATFVARAALAIRAATDPVGAPPPTLADAALAVYTSDGRGFGDAAEVVPLPYAAERGGDAVSYDDADPDDDGEAPNFRAQANYQY